MTPSNDETAHELRREIADLDIRGRVLVIAYLLFAGVGGEYAAYMLLTLGESWIAWSIALLVVEPIALACLIALMAIAAPDSIVAQLAFGALRRASIVAAVVIFSFVVGVLGLLLWTLWLYFTA